jgi:hypothetical protein
MLVDADDDDGLRLPLEREEALVVVEDARLEALQQRGRDRERVRQGCDEQDGGETESADGFQTSSSRPS